MMVEERHIVSQQWGTAISALITLLFIYWISKLTWKNSLRKRVADGLWQIKEFANSTICAKANHSRSVDGTYAALIFFSALLFLSLPHIVIAGTVSLTPQERAWLSKTPEIRIGIDRHWMPYVYERSPGKITGVEPDLVERINTLTGANIKLVLGDWKDAVAQAERGELHGIAVSVAHPERAKTFLFSSSPYKSTRFIYVRGGDLSPLTSMSDLNGKKVGMLAGNLMDKKTLSRWPEITLIEKSSNEALATALLNHEIDGAIFTLSLSLTIREKMIPDLRIGFSVPESEAALCYSINNQYPELLSIINKGLEAIEPKEVQAILDKWGANTAKATPRTALTDGEMAWLKAHPVIQTRIFDFPPINYWENGPRGIAIETAEAILGKLGVRIEYQHGIKWSQTLDDIRTHNNVDLLLNAKYMPGEETFLTYSSDYLTEPLLIFTRTDDKGVLGLEDLSGKTVAIEDAYALREQLAKEHPYIKQVLYENTDSALTAVSSKQADAYIGGLTVTQYYIANLGFSNIKVAAGTTLGSHTQAFAVRKDWPELVSILDKGLNSLSVDERNAIQRKYTSVELINQVDYVIVWKIASVMLLIVAGIVYWNRSLTREIRLRKLAKSKYQEINKQLESLAYLDGLTGVANRRQLDSTLATEWRRCQRSQSPLAIVIIDIDHFKLFNDIYGHQAGDDCLRKVALSLKTKLGRASDLVARYGGEEFVCLFPETDFAGAMAKAEELRNAVEYLQIPYRASTTAEHITISLGVAVAIPQSESSPEKLLDCADKCLYKSKSSGRNNLSGEFIST